MRLPLAFLLISTVLPLIACGQRDHAESACTPGVQAPARPSTSGIALPADFPDDVHRPSFAYSVTNVHQQTEMHLHANVDSEQSLADVTATLRESGWSGASTTPMPVGAGRLELHRGCRTIVVMSGADPAKGGSALVLRASDSSYQGCLSGGNDNLYPNDGEEVRMSGKPFADMRLPGSLELSEPAKQQTSVMFLVDASIEALRSDYQKALAASCWSFPPGTPDAAPTIVGAKGDRKLVVSFYRLTGGTEVVLNMN